ncbi:MAG: 3-phosphoshikimate 1-carboxyvinyltransferase [Nitrospirales bacterium]|nr:3-phosphoshikimate 1-carboxyvinyltransferase [Nitrospirales bacterium]
MTSFSIGPASAPLRGTVTVPGDKSITHRALILGALADGSTRVTGYCQGEDCLNTLRAIRQLGVEVREIPDGLEITGKGLWGLVEPVNVLDCGNSGTGLRLLAGVLAGQGFFSVLTGDASLRSRPMARIVRPLKLMGAQISGRKGGDLAPLGIQGQELTSLVYESPVASAQIKSCVLLAGLFATGTTVVTEPQKSRDHTERLFAYLGIPFRDNGCRVEVQGRQSFKGKPIDIPGDISAAAFFLVAATIVPDSEVFIPNIGLNPERTGILDLLLKMGADISVLNPRTQSGEPVGDLRVRSSGLHGISIGAEMVPKTIDEFPILCVAAALAEGETRINGAKELRVKETDRIHAMATELQRLNVSVEEEDDGLVIQGNAALKGAVCRSYGDHRVAMSLAVAGLAADSVVSVDEVDCIETSFPGFHGKLLDLLTN